MAQAGVFPWTRSMPHTHTSDIQGGVLNLLHRSIGSFTRDMAAASGDVAYTGLGFSPDEVTFISWLAVASFSVGFDKQDERANISERVVSTRDGDAVKSIWIYEDGTKMQSGFILSLDADGFTITWVKIGVPNAVNGTVYYFAKGGDI